jgi:hypothetical protein
MPDVIDYIFNFPDKAAFLRDLVIAPLLSSAFNAPMSMLVFNPAGATTSPAVGYWPLLAFNAPVITALSTHPNMALVVNQTAKAAKLPSVIASNIDTSRVQILADGFAPYVTGGII